MVESDAQRRPSSDPFERPAGLSATLARMFPSFNRASKFDPVINPFRTSGSFRFEGTSTRLSSRTRVRTNAVALADDEYRLDESELEYVVPAGRAAAPAQALAASRKTGRLPNQPARRPEPDEAVVRVHAVPRGEDLPPALEPSGRQPLAADDTLEVDSPRRIPRLPVPIMAEVDPAALRQPSQGLYEAQTPQVASSATRDDSTGTTRPLSRPASNGGPMLMAGAAADHAVIPGAIAASRSAYPLSVRRSPQSLSARPLQSSQRVVSPRPARIARSEVIVGSNRPRPEVPSLDEGPPPEEASLRLARAAEANRAVRPREVDAPAVPEPLEAADAPSNRPEPNAGPSDLAMPSEIAAEPAPPAAVNTEAGPVVDVPRDEPLPESLAAEPILESAAGEAEPLASAPGAEAQPLAEAEPMTTTGAAPVPALVRDEPTRSEPAPAAVRPEIDPRPEPALESLAAEPILESAAIEAEPLASTPDAEAQPLAEAEPRPTDGAPTPALVAGTPGEADSTQSDPLAVSEPGTAESPLSAEPEPVEGASEQLLEQGQMEASGRARELVMESAGESATPTAPEAASPPDRAAARPSVEPAGNVSNLAAPRESVAREIPADPFADMRLPAPTEVQPEATADHSQRREESAAAASTRRPATDNPAGKPETATRDRGVGSKAPQASSLAPGREREPLVRAWRDGVSAELPPVQFPHGYYSSANPGNSKLPASLASGRPAEKLPRAERPARLPSENKAVRFETQPTASRKGWGFGLFRRLRERWEKPAESRPEPEPEPRRATTTRTPVAARSPLAAQVGPRSRTGPSPEEIAEAESAAARDHQVR